MHKRIGSAIPIRVAVVLAAGVGVAGAQQTVSQYRSTNCPVQIDSVRLYGSGRDTAVIYRSDSTIVRDSLYASRPDSLVMFRADSAGVATCTSSAYNYNSDTTRGTVTTTRTTTSSSTTSRYATTSRRIPLAKEPAPPPPTPAPDTTTVVTPTVIDTTPPPPPPPVDTVTAVTTTTTSPGEVMLPPMRHWGNGFYVGLGAGASVPVQAVRNGYDPGLGVSVPIGWDSPTSPLGVRVNFGYNRLRARTTFRNTGTTTTVGVGTANPAIATDDAQLWSAIADAKLRLPFMLATIGRSAPSVYAVGGAGINWFRNFNTTFAQTNPTFETGSDGNNSSFGRFAWNVGGGLSYGIGASELFLESRYVRVMTNGDRLSYVPVILGVNFR
jgi:opacity protein-like surface antigen